MSAPGPAELDDELPDGDPAKVVRRAPFGDSPFVGERGQKAQLRILEAALRVFGEVGYHECSVRMITEASGFSRASFYQYFSSKEDVFRHLAGRVSRELAESGDAMQPVTGDAEGWAHLHTWADEYAAIYGTYEAVFLAFQAAADDDEDMAQNARVLATKTFDQLRSRLGSDELPAADVDAVAWTLLQSILRANREWSVLAAAYRSTVTRARLDVAIADVFHRALHGVDPGVNVHDEPKRLRPRLRASAEPEVRSDAEAGRVHGPLAQRTREQLLEVGRRVFIERGYYGTRVTDVVKAAEVSHGVFYRYFDNTTHLFHILAVQARERLADALAEVPPLAAATPERPAALRSWMRRYATTYAEEAALFSMWSEAMSRDDELSTTSATGLERYRRTLAKALEPRGWGDADAEALVFLVLVDALGDRELTDERVESFARIVERGLLTGPRGAG